MKIRALKTTTNLPRGCVAEVDDYTARELIAQGYAIEELPLAEQEAAKSDSPLDQTGGLTGADVPQSSLLVGRVPQELILQPDADNQPYVSSPSTTDTNSADRDPIIGQTPSTPATTTGGKRKRGRPRSRR